jgi:hypothetical protein
MTKKYISLFTLLFTMMLRTWTCVYVIDTSPCFNNVPTKLGI